MTTGANWRLENGKSPAAMLQENNLDTYMHGEYTAHMCLVSCCTCDVYMYVSKLVTTERLSLG